MQKMSGADLYFAVAEMKELAGKRIARIRRTGSGIFLVKIGSGEILFQPGVRLHMTRQALAGQDAPDGFVAFLRKHFEGKTAAAIEQHDTDRILEIITKSNERLVFELFRKGNLIAVGEDGVIAAAFQKEEAGGRRIARGERYEYPKATGFEMKLPEKIGFSVRESPDGAPVSYSTDASAGGRAFQAFSDALDHYYANQKEESEAERGAGERLKKLQDRLASQEKTLERMGKEREEAKACGDAVYANYEKVEQILALVRQMKKDRKSEQEINAWLSSKKARLGGAEVEAEL